MFSKKLRGSALPVVLIVLAVLSITGAALMDRAISENKQVAYQRNNMQAYYVARSGADAMASYITKNPGNVDDIINKTSIEPGKGSINGNEFEVKVIQGSTPGEIVIQSTGVIRGAAPVTVSLTLSKAEGGQALSSTIFSDQQMDLGNNTTIQGDIGTNQNTITFGNNKTQVAGNVELGPDAQTDSSGKYTGIDYSRVTGKVEKMKDKVILPSIDTSKFIQQYSDFIGSNNFNVGSQKLYIKVNNISLKGNDGIVVSDNGELHILVTGSISMGGNSSITTQNGAKIFIYYTGTQDINLHGGPSLDGLIYAPNANISWKGGGNETLHGSIIAKSLSCANSNTQIIYDGGLPTEDLPLINADGYVREQWGN